MNFFFFFTSCFDGFIRWLSSDVINIPLCSSKCNVKTVWNRIFFSHRISIPCIKNKKNLFLLCTSKNETITWVFFLMEVHITPEEDWRIYAMWITKARILIVPIILWILETVTWVCGMMEIILWKTDELNFAWVKIIIGCWLWICGIILVSWIEDKTGRFFFFLYMISVQESNENPFVR